MADDSLEPGMVQIRWTAEIKCGPGVPVTEVPVWSNKLTLTDLPPNATLKDVGALAFRLFATGVLEDFLVLTGVAEPAPHGMGAKDTVVSASYRKIGE